MNGKAWALICMVLTPLGARADLVYKAPPRMNELELKFGGFKPLIDREPGLIGTPYADTFGGGAMLLFEIEGERYLWQGFGALGIAFSAGYAEKYGPAQVVSTDPTATTSERTSIKVIPLRLLGVYRLDYGALRLGIPLVPYLKGGLVYNPWWVGKGSAAVEYVNGVRAAGGRFGLEITGGLSLMLDFFEPRLARDFYSDLGVVHSYLFGEFTYAEVNGFGSAGIDLSSRHWMFGLAFEY